MILLIDLILVPCGLIVLMVILVYLKFNLKKQVRRNRNLMILSPSGYESVKSRGVEHLTTLDNDFFQNIYFVCTGSTQEHNISISQRLSMVDVEYPQWIKWLNSRGFKYFIFLIWQGYSLIWLSQFIIQKDISIVRSMEPHNSGLKGVLLKYFLGIKHIQDIRANFDLIFLGTEHTVWLPSHFPIFLKKISRFLEKKFEGVIYKNSDFVFGGNKNNMDYAIYCGANLEKSAVVRVNIQPDLFDALSLRENIRSDLKFEGKIIAYCGRLSPEKYPKDVLIAFKEVLVEYPDTILLIIGDGPCCDDLKQYVSRNNLEEKVRFLGFTNNQYLKNLFVSIDAIVCPLAGSVLIEAALAQLPIVAYDFEWHSEVVVEYYSGLLVQFRNISNLAKTIAFLLKYPDKAEIYGKRAREIVSSLLLPEHIIKKEASIYSAILN